MTRSLHRSVLALGVVLLCGAGASCAAEPDEKADEKAQGDTKRKPSASRSAEPKLPAVKPDATGRVYTAKDIERLVEAAKAAPVTPLPEAGPARPQVVAPRRPAAPVVAASSEGALSFSNDDLERMFGKPEKLDTPADFGAVPPPAPAAKGLEPITNAQLPDPLDEIEGAQAARTAAELRRADARARVKELEGQVAELERNQLALRNPFLARPPVSPEEEGMPANERAARLDQRLTAMRAELARARRDFAAADAAARSAGAPPLTE